MNPSHGWLILYCYQCWGNFTMVLFSCTVSIADYIVIVTDSNTMWKHCKYWLPHYCWQYSLCFTTVWSVCIGESKKKAEQLWIMFLLGTVGSKNQSKIILCMKILGKTFFVTQYHPLPHLLEGMAPYGRLLLAPTEGWWPLAAWRALRALLIQPPLITSCIEYLVFFIPIFV